MIRNESNIFWVDLGMRYQPKKERKTIATMCYAVNVRDKFELENFRPTVAKSELEVCVYFSK